MEVDTPGCPLCGHDASRLYHRDAMREYNRCPVCQLVFVPPRFHLSPAAEKAVYDMHENSPEDLGYRRFLSRLYQPLVSQLEPSSRGLDFGSGPGPTLSVMFEEAGHSVALFDPYYAPNESVLSGSYDFVTASEVVEHLCTPSHDLTRMWNCVRSGGWLGIMTKRVISQTAFETWHYKNDPTHVSFFSDFTFEWLADRWEAELSFPGPDVVLFFKG